MHRLFSLAILSALMPCAWGDTQVGQTMNSTWGCGRISVTIKVYKDVASFPGLYRWDYDVTNTGIPRLTHDCGVTELTGLNSFTFVFPQETPDLQNVTVPAGWTYGIDIAPVLAEVSQAVTTLWFSYDGAIQDASLAVGETAHFSFTTLPRPAVNLSSCETVPADGLDKLAAACGSAGTGGVQECLITPPTSAKARTRRGRSAFVPGDRIRRSGGLEQKLLAAACDDLTGDSYAPGPAGIDVSEISFDGVSLQIDSTSPVIQAPHWILNTKAKLPASEPYDAETSAPAAFLKTAPLTFHAQFKSAVPVTASCAIEATLTSPSGETLPWGNIAAITVAFANGASEDVQFTVPVQTPKVGAFDVRIDWRALSCLPQGSVAADDSPLTPTRHRIYSLWKQPVAPQVIPWAKVLELSSPMLASASTTTTDENAVEMLADAIFYSRWTDYDAKFYRNLRSYKYNPQKTYSCGDDVSQSLNLQTLLDRLAVVTVEPLHFQCNDNSNLHAILAASQGIQASPTRIHDTREQTPGKRDWIFIATALHQRAGESDQCRQGLFKFHQVSSLDKLYDTSIRAATGSMESCTAGQNFFGLTTDTYFSTAFPPPQPNTYIGFSRPTVEIGACPVSPE